MPKKKARVVSPRETSLPYVFLPFIGRRTEAILTVNLTVTTAMAMKIRIITATSNVPVMSVTTPSTNPNTTREITLVRLTLSLLGMNYYLIQTIHQTMKKSNTSILNHIPDFLDYCEVERGLSSKTQENYLRYLKKFKIWLKSQNNEGLLPHQLTSELVWKYRLYLSRYQDKHGEPLAKSTQNYYLIALRAFLSYFIAKDVTSLPPDKIQLPKDAHKAKSVKFLTLEQIEKLLDAPNPEHPSGLRDKAILEALFSTGLRIAELIALNKEQFNSVFDKKDFELGVIGKGKHPRIVFFSEKALDWLKRYLKTRKDNHKALFINYRDRKKDDNRLTARSIERIIKKYAIVSGIPMFTTPHTLRHSYATDMLTQGVDLRTIQEFLGHKNIVTTQIYTHVTNKRLRDIHRKFHGGKNLEKK